jgi:glucose-1-phosphate adenylyltransferase
MGSDFYESIDEIKANIERGKPHIGIGSNTAVRRAILDKNVRIGKNVKLLNSGGLENYDDPTGCFYIREGIIIVPKSAVVADGTEI